MGVRFWLARGSDAAREDARYGPRKLFGASLGARLLGSFPYGIGSFDLTTDAGVVVVVATLGRR